ncbi:glycosyltransferase family 4 protein [Dysgonomonas sp. 520]|uniref:glycosyltransferase family 4 protein n=1 Tax=Dysgonomonas sp. 520 TaxID=2302931 RepID=UPI0013D6A1A6|nr:glycosyltransferase family 4 protein [Dysgonomonas sp. 520]NDW08047.1 glycosyltransferase [Dysgonomonas sp. 520]
MKVIVTGTRGIPNIQGGVETHCEKLYPLLVSSGCDVELIRRSCYVTADNILPQYKGVKIKDIFAPRKKSIEAIVHTFLAVCYAKRQKADILHIHAIGPALMTPFARLLGMKVVVTHHGADYDRQKWGKAAKLMLKTGERWAAKYANHIISISNVISNSLKEKYNRTENVHLIYNGVDAPLIIENSKYIETLGLEKGKYIFTLGRFVEEKGFHNLIEAYRDSKIPKDIKLVIAGDADHETEYSTSLKKLAKENNIILTGFIKGEPLAELFSHAALFVLPSFHEGLPISLLEAMSYSLDAVVSNIPANLAVNLPAEDYFDPHNTNELINKLEEKLSRSPHKVAYNLDNYNWETIAEQTLEVYKKMI